MADVQNQDDDRERVEITPEDVGTLNIGKLMQEDYEQIVKTNEDLKINVGEPAQRAFAIWVAPESQTHHRGDADEVFVLHWEDAGVIIPWPEGMTVKEAIVQWAGAELPRLGTRHPKQGIN